MFFKAMAFAMLLCMMAPLGWAEEPMFNHLPYPEASSEDLVTFQGIKLHKDMLPALKKMQRAARQEGVHLVIQSGFRSVRYQRHLFYDIAKKRKQSLKERAKVSAPPGHSEHHTGFAIDFDDRDTPALLNETFKDTKAGKWLAAHAQDYGFEMSFPPHNKQGVLFEPWHWRWVGSLENCALFSRAREIYPDTAQVSCSAPRS